MKNKKKTEFEDSLIATVCKVIHDLLHEVLIFLGHNFLVSLHASNAPPSSKILRPPTQDHGLI